VYLYLVGFVCAGGSAILHTSSMKMGVENAGLPYSGFISREKTFTNCLKIDFCGEIYYNPACHAN